MLLNTFLLNIFSPKKNSLKLILTPAGCASGPAWGLGAPFTPADVAGGDGYKEEVECSSSPGSKYCTAGQDEPGGGGQWPSQQEETVADEGGEADGACQRSRLAGTLYRPGDRQEGAGVEEVSGHST